MSGSGRHSADALVDEVLQFLEPLVPVSELDQSELPLVEIEPSRVEALYIMGASRAKDSRGTIENHVRGVRGEYAVAKHLRVPDEFDEEIYEEGDPGFDLTYRGWRIDVKTVGPQVNNPSLPVPTHGNLVADYYILVHQLNRQYYRIVGCASRPEVRHSPTFTFSRSRSLWPDRYGDEVYLVEQNRLSPIARLGE